MELTYSHEHVLILGGSSEIGLEIATRLSCAGIRSVLSYATDAGKERISAQCPELGAIKIDLHDPNSFADLTSLAPMDALVDLAHEDYEALLASVDDTQLDSYFSAHIQNRAKILRHITRQMLARRHGRLVHVSSLAAGLPGPGQGLYAASKMAAEALYHTYGLELASRGITSVNLRLGLVRSGRGEKFVTSGATTEQASKTRPLSIEQAAGTIMFLLSNEQAFHCTTLTMDAGFSAHKY